MIGRFRQPPGTGSWAPRGQARAPSRGIALVLVLWVLALLTVMALGMTATQRTEIALTDNRISDARFRALADAAIAYMAMSYIMPAPEVDLGAGSGLGTAAGRGRGLGADPEAPAESAWIPNGATRDWAFAGERVGIAVFNERSRIDLNQADPELLAALMVALGETEEDAASVADAIVDWRDEDDLKLLNGAEDDDYEAAGRPIGAKDEPFVAVEELQQVLGMRRDLYLRLAGELTVDTEDERVDQQFATPAVVAALQGISLEEAQIQVQERDSPVVPGGQGPRAVSRGGPLYRVRVSERGTGSLSGSGAGQGRSMEALVELAAGQEPPYRVLWRRFGQVAAPPPLPASDEANRNDR